MTGFRSIASVRLVLGNVRVAVLLVEDVYQVGLSRPEHVHPGLDQGEEQPDILLSPALYRQVKPTGSYKVRLVHARYAEAKVSPEASVGIQC